MRHGSGWAIVAALTLGGLGGQTAHGGGGGEAPAAPAAPAVNDPLIVHEWGTFTSMSGAEGAGLEGLQHEEEALPEFVYSRSEVRDCPLRKVGWKGLEVPASHVTQKMETPVIYVHSKTRRELKVRVDFVRGLLTQWYPVSDRLGPPELACDAGPLDLRQVERSFLEWDLNVIPPSEGAPAGIPEVGANDPWAFAREVESAYLLTKPRQAPERQGPVEAEHYLFYRGLGTFTLPFGASAESASGPVFVNASDQQVDQVVALEVGPGGTTARYAIRCYVAAGAKVQSLLTERALAPIESVMGGLEADIQKILEGQGLYADEARAMVRTWSRSWFRSEGLRFIYTVPRPLTDSILPLTLTPAPDQLVRVLVGRLEVIPRQTRREVEAALLDAASPDEARRAQGEARLARLGRFLEPHLRDLLASAEVEPEAKTLAEARLASSSGAPR